MKTFQRLFAVMLTELLQLSMFGQFVANAQTDSVFTVNVQTAGTFGQVMLQNVENWTDVVELTVTGHLNSDDMAYFSRMQNMKILDVSQTDITSISGCKGLELLQTITFPESVKMIGSDAFNGCKALSSINLNNIEIIGDYAFYHCLGLTGSIVGSHVKHIGFSAFTSCDNIDSLSFPIAEEIGANAFLGADKITFADISKCEGLGERCFDGCHSLSNVKLSEQLQTIPRWCFNNTALQTIKLPTNLTSIEMMAFKDCPITSISLPSKIQLIEYNAFNSPVLSDVYCYAVTPPTNQCSDFAKSATLHVPAFSVSAYKLDENWYMFNKIVALEDTIDKLNINTDFSIMDYTGLADKIDLTMMDNAHLTVSANSTLNLGTFTQLQSTYTDSCYIDDWGQVKYYGSTLITNNEIKADNINFRLQVKTNRWNFISLPFDVNVSDIEYPEGTLWVVRKYSGADRAALTGNTWQNMTNGMILQAGEGYILHCANEESSVVEFVFHPVNNANKNGLFVYQDVVKPLSTYASEHAHNRSWNLVGNPYPAYFDTRCIEHNGVITVYDSGSGNSGTYTAYSLLDDVYVLRPNEAFFVQCPIDATSMTFKAEGRTHYYSNNYNDGYYSARSRQTRACSISNRHVCNFTLSNSDFTDRTRLVINPDARMDYEISCDASKFINDDQTVPQLYIYDNGIRYAINERPLGDGTISLGARFGQTDNYTIQLQCNSAEDVTIILTDAETGKQVDLSKEAYTFTAQAGTTETRFTLTIGGDTTGINTLEKEQPTLNNTIYDLQGRRINNQAQKGIYIVKKNGKSCKIVK